MNELMLSNDPAKNPFQPEYLTNNWRLLQAQDGYAYPDHKYVRVQDDVLTVIGRNVIIRFGPVPFPNGYYSIDKDNHLILEDVKRDPFFYPKTKDVDVLRLDPHLCDSTPPIYREEIAHIKNFLEYARNNSNSSIMLLLGDSLYVPSQPEVGIKISCELPVKGEGLIFDTYNLKLAFTEMLRYDYIFVWKDNRPQYRHLPIMIGLDWPNCALLGYRGMHGQHF